MFQSHYVGSASRANTTKSNPSHTNSLSASTHSPIKKTEVRYPVEGYKLLLIFFQKPKNASRRLSTSRRSVQGHDEELEIIDLVEETTPSPESCLRRPREDAELHNLHTNAQGDKIVRLPRQKPQFIYASGEEPDPPFLQRSRQHNDLFDLDSTQEDSLSPSTLMRHDTAVSSPFQRDKQLNVDLNSLSGVQNDSLEDLEATMAPSDTSVMTNKDPSPRADSSFANKMFDFEAFNGQAGEPELYSSPLMRGTHKRAHSPMPQVAVVKHRRVRKGDIEEDALATSQEIPTAHNYMPIQDTPAKHDNHKQCSVPLWVDNMDPDLIESLKGFVDFVD